MPVQSAWSDFSTTAASNSPAGSEDPVTTDNYLREFASRLRKLYDGETAGQIQFPATQNASSGANVLDDYEEGTWTPTVTASSGSITAYSASGKYTKVGNHVSCSLDITITTKGTAASSLNATLPFTAGFAAGGIGTDAVSTGKTISGFVAAASATSVWILYDGTTPFLANGMRFYATISYTV